MRLLEASKLSKKTEVPIHVGKYIHNFNVTPHSHDFYEFVYIESGSCVHRLNNSISILTPGDFFGMKPGDVHEYYNINKVVLYNCLFCPEAIIEYMPQLTQLPGLMKILNKNIVTKFIRTNLLATQRQEIIFMLRTMCSELLNNPPGWEIKIRACLAEFLVTASRLFSPDGSSTAELDYYMRTKHVLMAIDYVEKNYSKKISLKNLSDFCGLSEDYFARVFKQLCGLSPVAYLQRLRLSKAAGLLAESSDSISNVSGMVGFEDANYFTRIFTKSMGISPSNFRHEYNSYRVK